MENTEYQRIDQARKILDFASFKDFAEKLGVSPQVFYDIKNGKHGISSVIPATSQRALERLLSGLEDVRGWDDVVSRLDRIIELLEVLVRKEDGDGTR